MRAPMRRLRRSRRGTTSRYRAASAAVTRGLAEHVVRMPIRLLLGACRCVQRLRRSCGPSTNCSAITFIACRTATRTTGSPARAAKRPYHARGSRASSPLDARQLAGQHQPPCRRVDEQRVGCAEVPVPVAARQLVADQRVGGGGVGNAQQRFGDAHQQHAFGRRKVVLLQERLDAALRLPFAAHRLDPRARLCGDRARLGVRLRELGASATSIARSSARNAARIAAPSGVSGSSGIVSSAVSMGDTGLSSRMMRRRAVASIARARRACRSSSS